MSEEDYFRKKRMKRGGQEGRAGLEAMSRRGNAEEGVKLGVPS